MPLTDAAKNLMLEALDETPVTGIRFLSLHSAYSATGASEVTGGSPAYARKDAVWGAAASGSKALTSNVVFDVPSGATVRFIGFWTAVTAGTFLGMVPNGSVGAKVIETDDSQAADTIYCVAHGFTTGDKVVFFGAALPTGITAGTVYTVTTVDVDHFTIGATITADGAGIVQKIVEEVFGAQGTFTVQAAGNTAIDLNLV